MLVCRRKAAAENYRKAVQDKKAESKAKSAAVSRLKVLTSKLADIEAERDRAEERSVLFATNIYIYIYASQLLVQPGAKQRRKITMQQWMIKSKHSNS